ncbi:MAG: hypothetical protein H6581_21135 [Bacteroidia bacterium]|nr:hypothetical protein [Bacteroidia bacterium]
MKTPSRDLFQLIQSLSTEEKRFFKKGIHKENGLYESLFDQIARQPEYDEEVLKQKFASQLDANGFSFAKQYLYQSLLKSLEILYREQGATRQIRIELNTVDLLFSRELYHLCRKHLKRAKKLLTGVDNPMLWLELQDWEFKLERAVYWQGVSDEEFEKMSSDLEAVSGRIRTYLDYFSLNQQFMYLLSQSGFVRASTDFLESAGELLDREIFSDEQYANSIPSRGIFHNTWGVFYYLKGDFSKAFHHYRQLFGMVERNRNIVYDNPQFYVGMLFNYGVIALQLRDLTAVNEAISKLEDLPKGASRLNARVFYYKTILKSRIFLDSLHAEQPDILSSEIEPQVPRFRDKLNKVEFYAIYFNLSLINFCSGEYKRALHLLGHILNDDQIPQFPDIFLIARLIRLIIHFELGNLDLVTTMAGNIYRFLAKRQLKYRLESLVMQYMRKAPDFTDRKSVIKYLSELKTELSELRKDPEEGKIAAYFDFTIWIDAKIQHKSMLEILKERNKAG